jgi:predicted NAD/FAD-binding protein
MNDADIKAGSQPASGPPRLLDSLRETMRVRHYSRRTEETYLQWIKRFIVFSGKRHPRELGAAEVTAFLNHLALQRHVAASTQNQALAALLFLYKEVLGDLHPRLEQRRPWCARRSLEQGPHLWGCDGEGARYDCGIIPPRSASSAVAPTG